MQFFRKDRVQSLIQKELAVILLKEVEVQDVLLTLTEVEVDKKLDQAKVKVSVLPSEKAPIVFKELTRRAGELQHLLNRKLNIKPMPRILFVIDRGPEMAARVEKALLNDNTGE
jgi:ribosome-binding factor A